MPPGSLNPKPLPPLKHPDAPSTPAKKLFARKSTPFPDRRARLAAIRRLPRQRRVAADHWSDLASHAAVA
jgi:hypothetical protein